MDFLDEIAALTPVPAGRAACAHTANLGMALVYKVLLFELSREELDSVPRANLRVAQKKIERINPDLKKLITEDPKCYVGFDASARSGDRAAGKSAFLDTMICSRQVMEKAFAELEWVRMMSTISSLKLAPHLRVAAELLEASIAGTAHLVRENLKTIKSPEKRKIYLERLETLYKDGRNKKKDVMEDL